MFNFLRKKLRKFEQAIEQEVAEGVSEPVPETPSPRQEQARRKVEAELQKTIALEKKLGAGKKAGLPVSEKKLDELLWDLEMGLLEADVALPVVEDIKQSVKRNLAAAGRKNPAEAVRATLQKAIANILSSSQQDFDTRIRQAEKPVVLMFVGVNGTGKTTTIAKIAHRLQQQGLTCVLGACDTFRAGAIEQLTLHAERLGAKIIKHQAGTDPAAVAFDAIKHARARYKDVVLLDTAGRMQTNVNLMDEMRKLKRVAQPDMIVFVGDALTGNDAVEQAKRFDEVVGIDGIILNKVDADAKGGAALSIAYTIGKPLLFIGNGQEYDDQIAFTPEWMIERLFD
ncbi:MAG: signal recognition particle-docking protein FtsY [Candidatus Thermoplasmatota archaeon]|nr:signal recognition particle-docking protein FtsY [Candidatus Thermoplasmatota archaeon]